MRIEIPECRRCLFCMPLRYGVLTFGYISLIFSLLCIALEIFLGIDDLAGVTRITYRGNEFLTRSWLAIFLYLVDIAFVIVLLFGAHMKRVRLLIIYYYYGITTTLASFLMITIADISRDSVYMIIDVCFVFLALVIHIYMLFMVRSLIKKLRQASGLSYVNHVSEVLVESPEEQCRNPL
ncbi:uncharacterized protein LOC119832987 [Zerene cesonia]|uniref:uncharacterized protein LOC119832987 n=1 Tax=Zerene cesonia TaxID=33412 RepID=UPI0018E5243E|nr:uncharacterized protein LOC119832987 [Zerene cesonia]